MALAQLDGIRKVFDRVRGDADHGDGELLTRYRRERDQDAFGSLVRRHGPMVLGVCQRVLRDSHAAEDAFQATFVVLAKKADAVRPPDRLAPWLYGVAYRTALKARGRAFRRHQVEQEYAAEASNRPPASSEEVTDLSPVIDEQLNALPEKYRTPLVLCAVQGLNKAEAAERLGLPEGTVSSRLARAREMLRDRLSRRGVVVPAVALGTLLTADTLQAAVPPAVAASTASVATGTTLIPATVLTLSHEVLRSMSLLKLKALCAVAMCAALAGGGFGVYVLRADDKKSAQPAEKPAVKSEKPGEKPGEKPAVKPEGDKPKPAKPDNPAAKLGGKVASVDAKERTITLAVKGDGGVVEKVFPVAEGVKVFIDGKEAKLADVPKNSTAWFAAAPPKEGELPVIAELRIAGALAVGVVKEVTATDIALEGEKKPLSFKITADTSVTINGKDAKATDLKAGDRVQITPKTSGPTALTIAAVTKVGDGEKPAKPAKNPTFGGKISAVDAKEKTITITLKGDREQVIKLTAEAKVLVDGKEAKLDAVPKGAFANFTIASAKDGQPREASEVRVSGSTFVGAVKQIDANNITIGNEKTDRVLKLLPGTKVTVNGKDAKVADLKTGDRVQVTLTADESGALVVASGEKTGDKPKPKPEKEDEDE
jgi:RNA polymerase sigma factor (sigma-70 family)